MSSSETDPLLPVENEEGHQAALSLHSQGNTEMAQLPPPPTNPISVPGSQAQLPPAQNSQQIQLSSSPGQAYFTSDGRICYQQPSQPVPQSQPGSTQRQPPGQMMFIPTAPPGNPQVWPVNQQQMTSATASPMQVWPANQQQMMAGPQVWPANQQQMMPAAAGPEIQPTNQQQMTVGTTVQVPYSATQPPPYTPVITAATVDLRPPSFTIMSFVVTFICFFLNITTLIFGVPAIILSIASEENKKKGEYVAAKNYGKIALGINIANIIYTAVVALAIVSGVLGGILSHSYYYY